MSKYQKLDSAPSPTSHADCEDAFSLYFEEYQNGQNGQNNNNNHHKNSNQSSNTSTDNTNYNIRLNNVNTNHNAKPQSKPNSEYSNNNGSSSSSSSWSHSHNNEDGVNNTLLEMEQEDHTWEVPLLDAKDTSSSSNMMENGQQCRSGQPGFRANLKSKSAREAKFKILLAISLCCIFMIIEFLGGFMAGSLAIMTDAAHLASDCISFIISLVAIWLGGRPPDACMSFGYKRFEVVGALISILGVWLVTAMLFVIAIQRIFTQDFNLNVDTMMIISGIGIGINIIMIFVLHGSWFSNGHNHSHTHGHSHSHSHTGHSHGHSHAAPVATTESNGHQAITNGLKSIQPNGHNCIDDNSATDNGHGERNMNLRAAMIHVIGDLVQSIGVFLAAVLIKFCPSAKYADPICTLLFSVIVILTTIQLFRESMAILLDAVPATVRLSSLESDLHNIEGVKSVHHLNVWQHTSGHNVLMVHIVIDLLTDGDSVLTKATQMASNKYNIKHSTIQIERLTV